jgi:hypothetical protein
MKLVSLAILAASALIAQDRQDHLPMEIIIGYQDAQACQNILSLNLPDVKACTQAVQVMAVIHNPNVKNGTVVITYTNPDGSRGMQQSPSPVAVTPAGSGIVTIAVGFGNVNDISGLSATVVADDGEVVTQRRDNQ